MKMMQSSNEGWLRRTSTALTLVVAVAGIAIGGAGCALGSRPKPVVGQAPAPKPEPYVLLKLGERRVYWVDEASGTPPESFPVAIGRKQYPTPTGRFRVAEMVENPDFLRFDWNNPKKTFGRIPPGPNNPLGLRWIAFANAHGWTVGFHGTTKTSALGQAVSHGCVRMSNPDVVKLYSRVKIGTPVIVEP
jgi:lipoprotein-anchoring transpeptidase ErfK/SrfK